jgi:hypothetical protein
MGGGTHVYCCDRCPLVLELGGHTAWGDDGTILLESIQVICASCGTMHRLIEQHGACGVTALPGPVRTLRTVTLRDVSGEEFESLEWASEADWRTGGQHAGGISAVARLPCSHCGQVGRMVTLAALLYPDGYAPGVPRREDCPVCGMPMQCIAITDSI